MKATTVKHYAAIQANSSISNVLYLIVGLQQQFCKQEDNIM